MIKLPAFISNNPRLAFYAFLAVAASGFGQTFFISVMGGRAVALAELGFPLSEAILPAAAVFIITHLGWRWSWLTGSLFRVCFGPSFDPVCGRHSG